MGADNVKFINFTKMGTIPSSALGQNRNNSFPISTGNFARELTFINSNEVYFEDPHADRDGDKAAAFFDSTGSVSGIAGAYVVANVPFMVDGTCTLRTAWNSQVCTGRRVNLRINNNGPEAAGPFTLTRDDGAAITLVGVPNTLTTGTTTALPGRSYTVAWGGAVPPKPRFFINRTQVGEWARITVPYPTGNIRVIRDYNSGSPLAQAASVADVNNATGAAWYYEAGHRTGAPQAGDQHEPGLRGDVHRAAVRREQQQREEGRGKAGQDLFPRSLFPAVFTPSSPPAPGRS